MHRARFLLFLVALFLAATSLVAEKLSSDQRIEILRGMSSEYATAKLMLPKSKKPLEIKTTGEYDKNEWQEASREMGPAARAGDIVQVTKVDIDGKKIVFELNGGAKGKRKWYQNIEVGAGASGRTTPINSPRNNAAPAGTAIALVFDKEVPAVDAATLKQMLKPILDFEPRSATEQYAESLPPEVQAAVKEKRAIEGMDRDQVLLALGKPRTKIRETREGVEEEDWIYGNPPGRMTFVTFGNGKVLRVKETYAGLGGSTAPALKPQI